jgi:hypothetical protein
MSDWLVNQLAWFAAFMTAAGLKLQLWLLLVGPLAVLVHEAGHALAALLLTPDAVDLHVGDRGTGVAVRIGRLRATLRPWACGQTAGHVVFRPPALGRYAAVAAAGPAASLAGALVGALIEVRLSPASAAGQLVGAFTASSAFGVLNLLPLRGKGLRSDGAQLLDVWRLARRPVPTWRDPNAATSVAPPGST